MKKILTLALVAAMLTATGITAFAADPTTDVTYEVAPVYTVVIPESVTLGDTAVTETIKIYGADENSNVVIGKTQKVNVALTASTNGFNVKNEDGETIAYTVNDKNAVDDLTTVAECAAGAKQNTDITFKKTGETKYAGTYTDTLTFTVSLEDAAAVPAVLTLTIAAHNNIPEESFEITEGMTWRQLVEAYPDKLIMHTGEVLTGNIYHKGYSKNSCISLDNGDLLMTFTTPDSSIDTTKSYRWL